MRCYMGRAAPERQLDVTQNKLFKQVGDANRNA
jgi:hypothetical protein